MDINSNLFPGRYPGENLLTFVLSVLYICILQASQDVWLGCIGLVCVEQVYVYLGGCQSSGSQCVDNLFMLGKIREIQVNILQQMKGLDLPPTKYSIGT